MRLMTVWCDIDAKIPLMHEHTCTTPERGRSGGGGKWNRQTLQTTTFAFITKNNSNISKGKLSNIIPEKHATKQHRYPAWKASIMISLVVLSQIQSLLVVMIGTVCRMYAFLVFALPPLKWSLHVLVTTYHLFTRSQFGEGNTNCSVLTAL